MNHYLLKRVLIIAVIVLVAVGLLTYVLAQIFDWSSLGTGIGRTLLWGFAALIALGILVRAVFVGSARRRENLDGVGDVVNDLYLGRVSSPPVVRSADEYSAFPPPGDIGR